MQPHDDAGRELPTGASRNRQSVAPSQPGRGGNAAVFVAWQQSLPASLSAGRRYDVAVTMRNTGTTTWQAEGDQPHRLGSQHPRDNTQWGLGRIDVPADVQPGAEVTFAFTVVAPETPGRYHFQWQMTQDGVGWFGELSEDVVVQVNRLGGPASSSGSSIADAAPGVDEHRRQARRNMISHRHLRYAIARPLGRCGLLASDRT